MKALQLHLNDNIAVCTVDVKANDIVEVMTPNGGKFSITAHSDVCYCNKIALKPIKNGEPIIKYGEVIGLATSDIKEGMLANHDNIASQPRAYKDEYLLT